MQITGLTDAVKKAIKSVSDQIMNATHDHDSSPSNPLRGTSHSHNSDVSRPESYPLRSLPMHGPSFGGGFRDDADFHPNGPPLFPKFHENFVPRRMDVPEILTFRLLCPDERVGGVIGKGGAIIRTLQHETGCDIKVLESNSDGEERMIIISGPAVLFLHQLAVPCYNIIVGACDCIFLYEETYICCLICAAPR